MGFLTVELYPFFTWILYSLESTFHLKFTWISIIVCKKYGPNFWQSFCKLLKKVKKFYMAISPIPWFNSVLHWNLIKTPSQKKQKEICKETSILLGIIEKIQKNLKHISTNSDLRSSYKKNYIELTFASQ